MPKNHYNISTLLYVTFAHLSTGTAANNSGIFRTEGGCKVDITVLDVDAMRVDEHKPDTRPEGIVHVYVNGHPVLKDGTYCGGRSGEVVLKKKL